MAKTDFDHTKMTDEEIGEMFQAIFAGGMLEKEIKEIDDKSYKSIAKLLSADISTNLRGEVMELASNLKFLSEVANNLTDLFTKAGAMVVKNELGGEK